MDEPRAVVIVVGDEILGGHTLDTNSHFLSQRLAAHGVGVARREVVPDDPELIARAIRRAEDGRPRFVFVVGGIGPTPDDRTYEGVALALHLPLEVPPEGRAWMEEIVRGRPYAAPLWADPAKSEPLLRMVRLPRGSRALKNPAGMALGCAAPAGDATLFVLPGVPRELEAMLLQEIEPQWMADLRPKLVTRELTVRGAEAVWYETLAALEKERPGLKVGSYPQPDGRIIFRLTGPAPDVEQGWRRLEAQARQSA